MKETEGAATKSGRKASDCRVADTVGIFKGRHVIHGVVSEAAEMRSKDENRTIAIGFGP